MKSSIFVFLLLTIVTTLPLSAQTKIIYASADSTGDGHSYALATSIKDALDRTHNKDSAVIYLKPGNYTITETLELNLSTNDTSKITIIGGVQEDGSVTRDNDLTVLDGDGTQQILRLNTHANNASLHLRILGLTFKNGLAHDDGDPTTIDHGGAISAYQGNADSSGTIFLEVEHCKLLNNKTTNSLSGGAVYSNCLVRLNDCKFRENEGNNGGAIIAYALPPMNDQTAVFEIEKCDFEENSNSGNQGSSIWHNLTLQMNRCFFHGMNDGTDIGNGSCIWGNAGSTHIISQCVFENIICKYWGAAIQSFGGNAYIDNCIFLDNKAGGVSGATDGYGAVAFYHADQPATKKRISNCTFVGNYSRYGTSSFGGAIHNRGKNDDDFKVQNCIFWDNGTMPVVTQMGVASISYSDIQSGALTGFVDGGSNINSDPLFADTLLHLSLESPCINKGTNTFDPLPDKDFDGNTRILSETIDMGAYEYNTAPDSIGLELTAFMENLDSAAIVGVVTGRDPDPEDNNGLRYDLIPGDGINDADNDLFELNGQELKFLEVGDYEIDSIYNIRIGIMDPGDSTFAESFTLKLMDGNDPVVLTGTINTEQSVMAGMSYSYTYPENMYEDQDGLETVTVAVSLNDDSALPDWLNFDMETRTFSGIPMNKDVDSLDIKIMFTDDNGSSVALNFGLKIEFTASLEENSKSIIQIYPNPATNHTMLSFDPSAGKLDMKIYNLRGECIMNVNDIRSNPYRLDLGKLDPGLYLIEIQGTDNRYLKLVKH